MKKIIIIVVSVFTISNVAYAGFPVIGEQTISLVKDECDNIILKDGSEISAKIIEITPDLVKYKKCGKLDGPLFTIYKSDILMLRYADGTKDIISNKKYKNQQFSEEKDLMSTLGFLSIMIGIFAWVIPSPLTLLFILSGITLGIISLVREENNVAGAIGLSISSVALIILLIALSL